MDHVRKASCRYDETRIRITLYRNHVGISNVMLENNNARAMNRRFSKIFVPATIHKLSRVSRIVGPSSRGGGLRRRRGFLTFTTPSLAPPPSPAASPRFIVHLSCFTPLEQQSSLTRQITERGSEEEKPVLGSSPVVFSSSMTGIERGLAREIVDLFIYPCCRGSHTGSYGGVIFILQTLNKAHPRRSTLETAY